MLAKVISTVVILVASGSLWFFSIDTIAHGLQYGLEIGLVLAFLWFICSSVALIIICDYKLVSIIWKETK